MKLFQFLFYHQGKSISLSTAEPNAILNKKEELSDKNQKGALNDYL